MTTTPEDFEAQREAKARAERDLELDIPKFPALREWIGKLEDWCRDKGEELEKSEKRVEELQDQVDTLEQESVLTADVNARLESMEQQLEDIERGVTTFEEFMDRRRRAY